MKKLQRILPPDPQDSDIPVPLLIPTGKRRYMLATIAVLIFTGILLLIILAVAPKLLAEEPAADTGNPEQMPTGDSEGNTDALPPDNSPEVDDLVATVPDGSKPDTDSRPETPSEPDAEPPANGDEENKKEDTPPVIVEQIVLSGSAGLAFYSNGDGTCTLEGLGDCTDALLIIPERAPNGDRVTAIAPRAFAGCTQLRAVQLPASLQSIGDRAFADCTGIAQLTVSPGSTTYTDIDGVLYSKDGTTLLLYPAARPTAIASIPAKVTSIGARAFTASPRLDSIHFEGSLDAWRKIDIGEGNEVLYTLPKTFE